MIDSTAGEEKEESGGQTAVTLGSPSASSVPSEPLLVDLPIPPGAELYAGVDVGTNSVKMIIADLAGGQREPYL